jgi:hypothetical protein
MIFEHYSSETRIDLATATPRQRAANKPVGLWLSVKGDADWPTFCNSDYPAGMRPERHLVTLRADANLLVLDSHDAVVGLAERFPDANNRSVDTSCHDKIDWPAVAREYDGIVVPQLQRHVWREMAANWYYGWDCSCACIWNMDAVETAVHQGPRDRMPCEIADDIVATIPTTREEAHAQGLALGRLGRARMYDLTGQMDEIRIPADLRGSWLSGVEDALEGDTDPDADGRGWERKALAAAA